MAVDAGTPTPGGSMVTASAVSPVRAWSVTGMTVMFIMVNWADKAILGIAAQPLMAELGVTAADIGFIGSAFFFLYSITAVGAGFVADRVGVRWMLVAMALVWSLTQLPVVLWASFAALLIGRILLGAAEGPAAAMANVAAYGWFPPERRGLPAALISSGASIAKIAAAPLLTLIVVTSGWRAAFLALALCGLVWAIGWVFVGRPGPYRVGAAASDVTAPRVPLRTVLSRPTVIGGVVGTSAMYALVTVVLTWLPSYFETGLGFSRLASGSMVVLPSIVSMATMVIGSALADRGLARGASARRMRGLLSAAALVLSGAILALLPLVDNPALAVAVLSVGYGLGGISLPLMSAAISTVAPTGQQPSVLGIFLALQSLSGLIAPAATGLLVEAAATPAAGYELSFQVFGLVALAGGLVIALTVHPERDRDVVHRAMAAART